MKVFDPVVLFSIFREMLGDMWWPVLAIIGAILLLWLIAVVRCRSQGLEFGRAVKPSIVIGIVVGVIVGGLLPAWTGASFSVFSSVVDVVVIMLVGIGVAVGVGLLLLPFLSLSRGRG